MTDKTKACNITEVEIRELMRFHGMGLHTVEGEAIDRINYLNKRLMSFAEPETKSEINAAGWTSAPTSSKGEDM